MANKVVKDNKDIYDIERILIDPYSHYDLDTFTIQELVACCYDDDSSIRFLKELANYVNLAYPSFLKITTGDLNKVNAFNVHKHVPAIQVVPFEVGDKKLYAGSMMLEAYANPKGFDVSTKKAVDYNSDESVEVFKNAIKNRVDKLGSAIAQKMITFLDNNDEFENPDFLFDEFIRTLDRGLLKLFNKDNNDRIEQSCVTIPEILTGLLNHINGYLMRSDKNLSASVKDSFRELKIGIESGSVQLGFIGDVAKKLRQDSISSTESRSKVIDIINCLNASLTRCRMMELVKDIRDKFDDLYARKSDLVPINENDFYKASSQDPFFIIVENAFRMLQIYEGRDDALEIVKEMRTVLPFSIFEGIDPKKLAIVKASKYVRNYDNIFRLASGSLGTALETDSDMVYEGFSKLFPYIVDYFVSFKEYIGDSSDIKINVKYPNGKKDILKLSRVMVDIDRIQGECPYGINMGDTHYLIGKSEEELKVIRNGIVEISKLQREIEEQMVESQRREGVLANTEELYREIDSFNREEAIKDKEDEIDLLYQQARSAEVLENSQEYWVEVDAYIKEQAELDKEAELYEQYQKYLEDNAKFDSEWETLLAEEVEENKQKQVALDAEWAMLLAEEMKAKLVKGAKLLVKIGAAILMPGESTNDTLRANNGRQWGRIDDAAARIRMEKLENRQSFYMDELNYVGMIVANDQVIYVEPSGYCYMEPANQSDIGKAAVYYGHYTDMYDLIAKFAAEKHLVKEEMREDTRNGKRNILWIPHIEKIDEDGKLVSEPWKDKVRAIEASVPEEKRDVEAVMEFIVNVDNMLKQTVSEIASSNAQKKIGSRINSSSVKGY